MPAMKPRVLLLMPSTTYRAADFLEAGSRLGVEVAVGSDQRQTLEDAAPGGSFALDFRDPPAATRGIVEFARRYPIRAVVGVEDETAVIAAMAAEALRLPHNPADAVLSTRDKHRMRELLKGSGIPVPEFLRISIGEEPELAAGRVSYPCVLKPLFLAASRGVIRADDPGSFVRAFERVRRILLDPAVAMKGGDAALWILAESYLPGIEVALEGLLSKGSLQLLALFDKPDPLEGPFFEETIYVTPSRLPGGTQRAIFDTVSSAAAALGLREGPLHAELRINDAGVWPLEVAARSIGGLCSRTLRFGAGISLEELILRHALGEEVGAMSRESSPAGVMMIPIPHAGILREFRGVEAARRVPGIEEVTPGIPVGQEVVPLPEGSRYLGFIFARAGTPAQVEEALREAHRRLKIVISPAAPEADPDRPSGSDHPVDMR
jgi:ATP-grasp domain-containing protein/L-aminoacid ligase-like protein